MNDFPVVDISDFATAGARAKKVLAERIDEVCRESGFLAVTGHGVPKAIAARAHQATRAFFDLELEEKLRVKIPYHGYPYGYAPLESEILARSLGNETPPDLKESFSAGPLDRPQQIGEDDETRFRLAPNLWPERPADFREAWSDYYRAAEKLAATLMRIFAIALNLDEDYFEDKIDQHTSAMRAANYPAQPRQAESGQFRAGAHTDYGSLTILSAENDPGGLEIFTRGSWHAVPALADEAFIINIGDLMARWTNDRWVSTLHRVVSPPGQTTSTRRLSIAFFHQPNWDAEISCIPSCRKGTEEPKYPPVTSGTHLMQKFLSTQ